MSSRKTKPMNARRIRSMAAAARRRADQQPMVLTIINSIMGQFLTNVTNAANQSNDHPLDEQRLSRAILDMMEEGMSFSAKYTINVKVPKSLVKHRTRRIMKKLQSQLDANSTNNHELARNIREIVRQKMMRKSVNYIVKEVRIGVIKSIENEVQKLKEKAADV